MFAFAIYDERRQRALRRARSAGQEAALLRDRSAARCTSRASSALCARARPGRATSISTRSRATSRSATSSRRTPSTATCASSSRATGCTSRTARIETSQYWDVTEFDTRRRARRRDRSTTIDATLRDGRARPARERGAARGVSLRRHRLGAGRLVHGRGARRSAGHDDGRLWRRGAQRARSRGGDGRALRRAPPPAT